MIIILDRRYFLLEYQSEIMFCWYLNILNTQQIKYLFMNAIEVDLGELSPLFMMISSPQKINYELQMNKLK